MNSAIYGHGDPVFRDTVHLIAEFVAQGNTPADLIEAYPRLTAEMIQLAPIYAAAHPRRDRSRKQPCHDQPPVHRSHRRLDTIIVPLTGCCAHPPDRASIREPKRLSSAPEINCHAIPSAKLFSF
jgi:uncharacterized protein (DUF433 family)